MAICGSYYKDQMNELWRVCTGSDTSFHISCYKGALEHLWHPPCKHINYVWVIRSFFYLYYFPASLWQLLEIWTALINYITFRSYNWPLPRKLKVIGILKSQEINDKKPWEIAITHLLFLYQHSTVMNMFTTFSTLHILSRICNKPCILDTPTLKIYLI